MDHNFSSQILYILISGVLVVTCANGLLITIIVLLEYASDSSVKNLQV